jgi:hypothetical protein
MHPGEETLATAFLPRFWQLSNGGDQLHAHHSSQHHAQITSRGGWEGEGGRAYLLEQEGSTEVLVLQKVDGGVLGPHGKGIPGQECAKRRQMLHEGHH